MAQFADSPRTTVEEVNQRAEEMAEEDDEYPGNLGAVTGVLVFDATDERADPEGGREKQDKEEETNV